MADRAYADYLQSVREIVGWDVQADAEDARLIQERQERLRAGADSARAAEALVSRARDDLGQVLQRLVTLQRRYNVVATAQESRCERFDDSRGEIHALADEASSLEAADAWLRRAHEQLAAEPQRTDVVPASVTVPVATEQPAQASTTPVRRLAWYWWAVIGVVVLGAAGTVTALITGQQ